MKLRKWQYESYQGYEEYVPINGSGYLVSAFPGAGKTFYALATFILEAQKGMANKIIVVVPSDNLREQWADNGHKLGLNLLPLSKKYQNVYGFDGFVMTYHQLQNYYRKVAHFCDRNIVLPIFDEIHHAGEEKNWGDYALKAFNNTDKKLLLSGTPFRSDENKIPFVDYVNGESYPNYTYGYRQAIEDGVCRPAVFNSIDGEFEYAEIKQLKTRTKYKQVRKKLSEDQSGISLNYAIREESELLKELLASANDRLCKTRQHIKNAGGLCIAKSQAHALIIAELIEEITGKYPVVVSSDLYGSNKKIEKFRNSNDEWIVAVRMISEGVDIPRLRALVYATNITSKLAFTQVLGRIIRGRGLAYFYYPADARLLKLAENIEQETRHLINKPETQPDLFDNEFNIEQELQPGVIRGLVDESFYGEEIYFHGHKVNKNDFLDFLADVPLYQYMDDLKGKINTLVCSTAQTEGVNPKEIHNQWMMFGRPCSEESSYIDLQDKYAWISSRNAKARANLQFHKNKIYRNKIFNKR